MLCKWLWKKTIANPDEAEGMVISACLMSIYPLLLLAPVVDALGLAGKGVSKTATGCAKGVVGAGRLVANGLSRAAASFPKQSGPVACRELPLDPITKAEEEYAFLQQRISQMLLGDDEKQALHLAVERRFVRALKERIDGS